MTATTQAASPTVDQRRAAHAWNTIRNLKSAGELDTEFLTQVKKLPTRILAAGLGQALAFILAKAAKEPALGELHKYLTEWVIRQRRIPGAKQPQSLLVSIVLGDSEFLRLATEETLLYLAWLNRFAEAEAPKGVSTTGD